VGIAEASLDDYRAAVDLLPNLQLLAGTPNAEKQAKLPAEWLRDGFASNELRETYVHENDLADLPDTLHGFPAFFAARRSRIRQRLITALGVGHNADSA
jgi:hypothetical protein